MVLIFRPRFSGPGSDCSPISGRQAWVREGGGGCATQVPDITGIALHGRFQIGCQAQNGSLRFDGRRRGTRPGERAKNRVDNRDLIPDFGQR